MSNDDDKRPFVFGLRPLEAGLCETLARSSARAALFRRRGVATSSPAGHARRRFPLLGRVRVRGSLLLASLVPEPASRVRREISLALARSRGACGLVSLFAYRTRRIVIVATR